MITQVSPYVLTGLLSELPNPATISDGYLFYATDTQELFVLVINQATQVRSWDGVGRGPAPTNPDYFVSNTGNDANPGTITLPLASVGEALRRLGNSGWIGNATITVLNAVTEGSGGDVEWSITAPVGTAMPILLKGTVRDAGPGTIVPTGGTTGVTFPTPALATINTSINAALNQYRGKFVRFTGGANNGLCRPIDSNTAGPNSTFVLTGVPLPVAPSNATPFVIEENFGSVTFPGKLRILGSALFTDQLEWGFNGSVIMVGGLVMSSRCNFIAKSTSYMNILNGAMWCDGTVLLTPPYNYPAGIGVCGSRWDGTAGVVSPTEGGLQFFGGNMFTAVQDGVMQFGGSSFINCIFANFFGASVIQINDLSAFRSGAIYLDTIADIVMFSAVASELYSFLGGGALELYSNSFATLGFVSISDTAAGTNVLYFNNSHGGVNRLTGANPAAAIGIVTVANSDVVLINDPSTTGFSAGAGTDVQVGSNAPDTFTNAFGGTTLHSTDLGSGSSQICRIGP